MLERGIRSATSIAPVCKRMRRWRTKQQKSEANAQRVTVQAFGRTGWTGRRQGHGCV
ncbi:uncharacterized protein Dvir_GJ26943 [Drosophila virilis]|uniref:Uncharacterized protein n=1 Tax=Drosophila virilis TaxID=7244 RepID=A0A0Q9WK65_DROVI|nr:uncharacterized protein Dvir_GJ26943 [Drosophila virilis]